jgi:hypothetical protein
MNAGACCLGSRLFDRVLAVEPAMRRFGYRVNCRTPHTYQVLSLVSASSVSTDPGSPLPFFYFLRLVSHLSRTYDPHRIVGLAQ